MLIKANALLAFDTRLLTTDRLASFKSKVLSTAFFAQWSKASAMERSVPQLRGLVSHAGSLKLFKSEIFEAPKKFSKVWALIEGLMTLPMRMC